jgi:hypothetical protein
MLLFQSVRVRSGECQGHGMTNLFVLVVVVVMTRVVQRHEMMLDSGVRILVGGRRQR